MNVVFTTPCENTGVKTELVHVFFHFSGKKRWKHKSHNQAYKYPGNGRDNKKASVF